jgi:haloacetate dehalogenase
MKTTEKKTMTMMTKTTATRSEIAHVLLLHGNPQTHVMWHKIAPRLATEFNVFAADLRGYGDSSKPLGGENHFNYSKRAMAMDQIELMEHLVSRHFL